MEREGHWAGLARGQSTLLLVSGDESASTSDTSIGSLASPVGNLEA